MSIASLLGRTGACLAFATLISCSGSESAETSQVVARVGDADLTAAQLDARVRRLPADTDPRDPELLKLVLKNFVDETLLAQAAQKDELDKKPSVARDIETSRNVVLANAYLSRNIQSRPPSEATIQRYYNDNPAMFSNRRTYRLTDIAVRENQPNAASVVAMMKQPNATIELVTAAARQANVNVESADGVSSGDNLPAKLAAGLVGTMPGDTIAYRVAQTQHLTRVTGISDTPLSLADAHDFIGDLLLNQTRETAVKAKLAQLRAATPVEYGKIGREIEAGRGAGVARQKSRPTRGGVRTGAMERGAKGL